MSACYPIADMRSVGINVRLVPQADIVRLAPEYVINLNILPLTGTFVGGRPLNQTPQTFNILSPSHHQLI